MCGKSADVLFVFVWTSWNWYLQVRIAEVENAVEYIVKSLARRIEESKLAVALLLELSKNNMVRDRIGKVQGCILILVTILTNENTQAARDAKDLLEILSFDDQNVVQMAKVNYFKPLLQRITSGFFSNHTIISRFFLSYAWTCNAF